MSRKHAPLPVTDRQTVLIAIARRRDELLAEGRTPVAVVLPAEFYDDIQPIWGNSEVRALLGMRAERGQPGEGWWVRCEGE